MNYLVWSPDYGSSADDAVVVDAGYPEAAAAKWAERRDSESADYLIVGGQSVIVYVKHNADTCTFRVYGETVAHYYARPA